MLHVIHMEAVRMRNLQEALPLHFQVQWTQVQIGRRGSARGQEVLMAGVSNFREEFLENGAFDNAG